MKLAGMPITSYLDLLGSDAPAPGGGSASALCGAQGAALTAMVAGLTVGKKKYAEYQELCAEIRKKALALKDELTLQADTDAEAFNLVAAAFKLPKETEQEKSVRSKAISDATAVATQVPLQTMKLCAEALYLAKSLVGRSNVNAASDLGVAALNLLTAIKGAWLNVLINLGGLSDEDMAKAFFKEGEEIVASAQKSAEEIYNAILEAL